MMNNFADICYIICYREESEERKQALKYVLRRIRKDFPLMEILIVEQDTEKKLHIDDALNVRHLFIYNPDLFNRSWAFNCGVNNSTKDVYVFADADIFLEKEGYIQCFEAMQRFEAVTPNKTNISNVEIDYEGDGQIHFLNDRRLHSFAGGMLILTKAAFDKIGGWDERFEGWGGEDDAMSHVIFSNLISKTFSLPNFHIDHPHQFVAGNNQRKYQLNRVLIEEILTRNGIALNRYVEQLKSWDFGDTEKFGNAKSNELVIPLRFILAITTYNRLDYLKECVESFLRTRDDSVSWQLIIADDNSTDGTSEYLKYLEEHYGAIIIRNNRSNIHRQVNTILKKLSTMTFDFCFKCDDDVIFIEKGWDLLYWQTAERTGYTHLIHYDDNWRMDSNLSRSVKFGNLESRCKPEEIQGAFYTVSKDVLDKVGYFDEQQFGSNGLGHVDFSFRCCRAGFNVLSNPFDVLNSNYYIRLQSVDTYYSSLSIKKKNENNSKSDLAFKRKLINRDRIYMSYNENSVDGFSQAILPDFKAKNSRKLIKKKYKKADATLYWDRGVGGFIGFLLKRFYNLSIDLKIYFIPRGIRRLAKALNRISIHLININQ